MARHQLSSKGRQEFGTWLANRLVVGCGGAFALVLVPALAGKISMPTPLLTSCIFAIVLVAAVAALIKYRTAERAREAVMLAEDSDV